MRAVAATLLMFLLGAPLAHAQDALPDEWKQAGLTAGMPYAKAKRLLSAAGWQVSPAQSVQTALPDFPEIECGQGVDAVCSAGFHKADQAVAMIVGTTPAGQPFVQGTY